MYVRGFLTPALDLIPVSAVVPRDAPSSPWCPYEESPPPPVSEIDQLVAELKKRSGWRLTSILYELVKDDVNKNQNEKLFPRLRTRSKIWYTERETERGKSMPATAAMDLSVAKNMSFSRLPFNMNFTFVSKVLFCFLHTHGKEEKSYTFAAAQACFKTSGGEEVMFLSVTRDKNFDRKHFVDEDLFRSLLRYMSKHVTHLVFYSRLQAEFMKSLFRGEELPSFTACVIGGFLVRSITGSGEYCSIKTLLSRYRETFASEEETPAPVRYGLKMYKKQEEDKDMRLRYTRIAIVNAKTMYFLYDRFRDEGRKVLVLPEKVVAGK